MSLDLFYRDEAASLYLGDVLSVLREMPDQSVHTVVTSPPYYGLRDYGTAKWDGGDPDCDHVHSEIRTGISLSESVHSTRGGAQKAKDVPGIPYRDVCGKCGAKRQDAQLGLEESPEAYVDRMVEIFREVNRVLRDDGTVWLNLGDSYAAARGGTHQPAETLAGGTGGYTATGERVNRSRSDGYNPSRNAAAIGAKHKDLLGIPWRVAFALQADGWYLRSDIIWAKPNPMPESVTDRPTKAHEYLFLLSKRERYYYDADAIREEGEGYGRGTGPGAFRSARYQNNASFDNDAPIPSNGVHGHSYEGGRNRRTVWRADEEHLLSRERKPSGTYSEDAGRNDGGRHESYGFPSSKALPNKRSVWTVTTRPYKEAHFATFPPKLIEPCILAGAPPHACGECGTPWQRTDGSTLKHTVPRETIGWERQCEHVDAPRTQGVILDPFIGSGTAAMVAKANGRRAIGIDLSPSYLALAAKRISGVLYLPERLEGVDEKDIFA